MKKLLALLLTFTCIIINAQTHSGLCFVQAPGSPFNSLSKPGNLAAGDFNNDGKQDLLVCNHFSSKVVLYLGNGNGTFASGINIACNYPSYIAVGDFNNDHNLDLVAASDMDYALYVFFGNGAGGFNTPVTYSNINYYPRYLMVKDINHDNNVDIICNTSQGNMTYYILLNNGSGGFSSSQFSSEFDDMNGFAMADVNGDNNQDMIFSRGTTNNPNLLIDVAYGNGIGGFSSLAFVGNYPNYSSTENGGNCHIATGDFNEDGKIDVAQFMLDPSDGTFESSKNSVFIDLNQSSNYPSANPFSVGNNPSFIVINDFNLDGHLDLSVTNMNDNTVSFLVGNGQGSFSSPINYSTGTQPSSEAIADFNNDGFMDLAITNYASSSVTVLLNAIPKVNTSNVSVCSGSPVTLNATVAGADTYTYLWNTGATSLSASGGNPVANTTYIFTATNSSNQCSATNTVQVVVHPNPVIHVVASPSVICAGNTATLTASGATFYTWSANAGSATTNTVSVSPITTTVYTVTGSNFYSCSTSVTTAVTVNPIPTINVNSATLCNGGNTTLTASGANTYTWIPGTSLSSNTGSSVITSATSSLNYTVTGSNSSGCTASAVSSVTVNPLPNITTNNPTTCLHSPAVLSASGALTYTWSPPTGLSSVNGSSVLANPSSTSVYTVTGTSGAGCVIIQQQP